MPILNMIAQGSGGGWWGSNVWEPTNLSASATSATSIDIKWTDNGLQTLPPSTFQKSVLVRKVGSAPTTPSDWTTVVTETVMNTYQSSGYSDTWLTDWTTYYYQVFSYSTDWGITYWTPASATPQWWWQPWVNTIAYYPLNWDANDYSWNGYNMSAVNTVTYEALSSWIQVAKTNDSQLQVDNFPSFAQDITVLLWVKQYENTSGYNNMWYWVRWANSSSWDNDGVSKLKHSWPSQWSALILNMYTNLNEITTWPFTDLTWNLWTATYNNSTKEMTLYQNDTVIWQGVSWWTPYATLWYFCLWVIWYGGRSKVYLSNCIVEDKVWTEQEISDYYDQTKANYWIS